MTELSFRVEVNHPDFMGAWKFALDRLVTRLSPMLYYHSVAHTRDDVVPATERLAEMEGVSGEDRLLLLTAAWYHDIGFIERYEDNESVAVQIARQILPDFGFRLDQIRVIEGVILATRIPQTPHNLLEEIMADADLDNLGREDFFERSSLLRNEMAAFGQKLSEQEWCKTQMQFLRSHRYFTPSAVRLRQVVKLRNMETLVRRYPECESTS